MKVKIIGMLCFIMSVSCLMAASNPANNHSPKGISTPSDSIAEPLSNTSEVLAAAPGNAGRTLKQAYKKSTPTSSDFRFTDNGDGTVTDNLTGLTWLGDANFAATADYDPDGTSHGKMRWKNALDFVTKLNRGAFDVAGSGNCGYHDWRLPSARELSSLIHFDYSNPALSNDAGTGHWSGDAASSFFNVQSEDYWSDTTSPDVRSLARIVYFYNGNVRNGFKSFGKHCVWPVR